MPTQLDPATPNFPHGTNGGYNRGCRASYPCPATPTCAEEHAVTQRRYHKRSRRNPAGGVPTGRITTNLLRRYKETLKVARRAQIAEFTGIPEGQIKRWLELDHPTRVTGEVPEALDRAWAWFVKGSDLTKITRHDENAYERAYCRCEPCSVAVAAKKKRLLSGRGDKGYRLIHHPALHAHVHRLIRAAGNANQVALITGFSDQAIHAIAADPHKKVRAVTAELLLRTTPAQVAAGRTEGSLIPADHTALLMGQMCALGYTLKWQMQQMGWAANHLTPKPGRQVQVHSAREVADLHARVGDRPASDADGISQQARTRAKNYARDHGYYPPIYYDEDGTLDYRSIEDHPWTRADLRASKVLPLAHAVARGDLTLAAAAEMCGEGTKEAERMRERIGLRSTAQGITGLDARSKVRAAWVRNLIEAAEEGSIGPVYAALAVGARHRRGFPEDHPDVAAWDAQRPYVEALAYLAFTRSRIAALTARAHVAHVDTRQEVAA